MKTGRSFLYLHIAVLLWGFTGVLGRAISLDALVLVVYRMVLTCLFVAIIVSYRKRSLIVSQKSLRQLAVIGFLMAIHWVAFFASIKLSNASIALVCMSTASIAVSVLDPILNKKKFVRNEILIGILALVGVYMIYRFQKFYAWGIFFGVLAAVLSAWFTILNKRITHSHDPYTMVFYEMGTGTLWLLPLLPIYLHFQPDTVLFPQQIHPQYWFSHFPQAFAQPNDWLWLILLSLCCTVWAQVLALKALRELSAFTTSLSVNLEPVYGIVLAIIFFKENTELNMGFYIGMLLIMSSVFIQSYIVLRRRQ